MKRFICIWFLSCVFAACTQQQTVVTALPAKESSSSDWTLLNLHGRDTVKESFKRQPSPVVNDLFTVPDTAGRLQLYHIADPTKPVCPNKFSQIGHFFENVTFAQRRPNTPLLLINREGKTVKTAKYPKFGKVLLAHNFKEGLALVYTENQKYGYIDTRGRIVIEPCYDCAYDFSEGIAIVGIANASNQMAYSAIDREGDLLFHIRVQNSRINGNYSCGRLLYKNRVQNQCAYLDHEGNTAIFLSENILETSEYKHNAALALTQEGIGLIAMNGEFSIPAQYDRGRILGPQRVAMQKEGKWGMADFTGRFLTEFIYDDLSEYYPDTYAIARIGEASFLIDREGMAVDTIHYRTILHDPTLAGKRAQVFTYHPPCGSVEEPVISGQSVPSTAKETDNPFLQEARKIISGELSGIDAQSRKTILEYMEKFRQSYSTKDIDFIEQVFSEDALIIVGKVVKRAPESGSRYLSSEQIIYNLKNKREYIRRLKAIFKANRKIQVKFSRFQIKKHPTVPGIYGVTVCQGYSSDLYSDEGYLFLLWDFRDMQAPQIHVRTWQPTLLDSNTPLPEEEIFSIRNFNIE